MIYAKLIAFSFLLASGQILFKQAALKWSQTGGILALLFNSWFILALTLYGVATLLWVLILRTTPLSLAYPFAALGFIIVPVASYLIFKEEISLSYIFGALMISGGIILTQMK